ncbi:enoyl-CoA hydratase-related protein [Ectobacillus polymachus]|uniref:enoyl-CoA hydratase-related protein n=1 Tax=Ectobacillus polymachus TaxID=1508806 RepID=UPI003A8C2E9D
MTLVTWDVHSHIAYVTISRPEVLNCLNYETLQQLHEIVVRLRHSPDVRIVIFTGAGETAFCAGADLKERKSLNENEVRRNVKKIRDVFTDIAELPQPTIAAINGYTYGGGFELMLACDFRIAVEEASMGLTEVKWAIIPGAGGTQRLPRLIGEARAKELILTGRKITAQDAYQMGLLNQCVKKEELLSSCEKLAKEILKNAPVAIQQAKYAINHGAGVDLHTGLAIEAKAYEITIPTQDRVEALLSFEERRTPNFIGK